VCTLSAEISSFSPTSSNPKKKGQFASRVVNFPVPLST
jgi:hypothetical protein